MKLIKKIIKKYQKNIDKFVYVVYNISVNIEIISLCTARGGKIEWQKSE